MIIVTIYDPSSQPEVVVKRIAYNTCDWPETNHLANQIEAILDEFSGVRHD